MWSRFFTRKDCRFIGLNGIDFDSAYGIETQHRIRSNEELVKTLLERNFKVYLGG